VLVVKRLPIHIYNGINTKRILPTSLINSTLHSFHFHPLNTQLKHFENFNYKVGEIAKI